MAAEHVILLAPGDLNTLTGGYIYDRRIAEGLRALGWQVDTPPIDASFPLPTEAALAQAERTLAALADGTRVVIDGLALGGMPRLVERERGRLRLAALVHHPLALETGLTADVRERLYASEREALAATRGTIVTGQHTVRSLEPYGVPASRIRVVEPGTDPAPLARGSSGDGLALLCVASLVPRKGHDLLVDALARLRDRPWRLTCVGSTERDPATSAALRARIERLGLGGRIQLAGELVDSALEAAYQTSDVFVLPAWHEGFGMAFAEALMRGLPVVATTGGAIPDTVPPTAGLLVPPGDLDALTDALARVLDDAALRARLADGARATRPRWPAWEQSSARFAEALNELVP